MTDVQARTRRTLNRDDLLAAVAAHIEAEGLRGFTLRGAAAAAGTTHKVLLYHFGSSDELIIEALDLIRSRLTDAGAAAIDSLPDSDLDEWLSAVWTMWTAPELQSPALMESLGLAISEPQRFGPVAERSTLGFQQAVLDGLARHSISAEDRAAFATLLLATLRGLSIDRAVTGNDSRTDEAFAMLRRALAGSLQRS